MYLVLISYFDYSRDIDEETDVGRSIGDAYSLPEVEIDYPLAFANAFGPTIKKPFRYLHCSGILAEQDQGKPLWFAQEARRIKVIDPPHQAFKTRDLIFGIRVQQNQK